MIEKKILIIDDEKDFVDMLKGLLETRHYRIVTALDGEAGFSQAVDKKPNLILSDIKMPKLDGYALIDKLKSHLETQDIPIIMISGIGGSDSIEKAKALGADDYLIKPLSLGDLTKFVIRYLD